MQTPKDWEIIAQTKDLEEIKKLLISNLVNKDSLYKKSILSVLLTVISTLISTFLATAFSNKGNEIPYYAYLIVGSIILFMSFIPFIKDVVFLFKKTPTIPNELIISSVDLFDNDIIYNTMMANKYYDMTLSSVSCQEKNFYLSETCYLCKKILHQLSTIHQLATTNKIEDCGYNVNKRIHIDRIATVLDFIDHLDQQMGNEAFSEEISSCKRALRNKFSI